MEETSYGAWPNKTLAELIEDEIAESSALQSPVPPSVLWGILRSWSPAFTIEAPGDGLVTFTLADHSVVTFAIASLQPAT